MNQETTFLLDHLLMFVLGLTFLLSVIGILVRVHFSKESVKFETDLETLKSVYEDELKRMIKRDG